MDLIKKIKELEEKGTLLHISTLITAVMAFIGLFTQTESKLYLSFFVASAVFTFFLVILLISKLFR